MNAVIVSVTGDLNTEDAIDSPVERLRLAHRILRHCAAFCEKRDEASTITLADAQTTVHLMLGDWLNMPDVVMLLADALRVLARAHEGTADMPSAFQSAATRVQMTISRLDPDYVATMPEVAH